MIQLDGNYAVQIATGVVGLLTAVAVGVQTWLKRWKDTQTEHSLIKLMHTELERMSKQNTTLSVEIGTLQSELIRLNNQLTALSVENHKLQSEVSRLNLEIVRLHSMINEKKDSVYGNTG